MATSTKLLQRLAICPEAQHSLQSSPERVPAEFDSPISTPACAGAMSMWFTEKPPLANAAAARVAVVARVPPLKLLAAGMASRARLVPRNPALHHMIAHSATTLSALLDGPLSRHRQCQTHHVDATQTLQCCWAHALHAGTNNLQGNM